MKLSGLKNRPDRNDPGMDVTSFEVRQLIGEYDFVARQLYQVKDARPLLMDIAKGYQENEELMAGMAGTSARSGFGSHE